MRGTTSQSEASRPSLDAGRNNKKAQAFLIRAGAATCFDSCSHASEQGLPGFGARELNAFLNCGVMAHGFARFEYKASRCNHGVVFSGKRRGFCAHFTVEREVAKG